VVCRIMILNQSLGPLIIFLMVCQTCLRTFHPLSHRLVWILLLGMEAWCLLILPFHLVGGWNVPQSNLMVGGWNIPSYGSNPSFHFPGESSQMHGHSTYYISSIYRSSAMPVPMNAFPMADLHLSSGVSFMGSWFYSMGNPLHEVPSSRGNIYPHKSNPCHVSFSLKAASLVSIPLHPFMNQFRWGYYYVEQGHGVYQKSSWPVISQN